MNESGEDGAKRLKNRIEALLNYVRAAPTAGRHIRDIEAYCLFSFGITPKTCHNYVRWLVRYGKVIYTNPSHTVVKIP